VSRAASTATLEALLHPLHDDRLVFGMINWFLGGLRHGQASPRWAIPCIWIDHRIDVPAWLAAEIGRVSVEWSDLEWQMEETIRLLVPTHVQHGRVITTGMSMRSRLKVAENLVIGHFHNGNLSEDFCREFRRLKLHIEKQEPNRNKLVHGVWGRVHGVWELLRTSGTRELPDVGSLPRAVLPQREPMSPAKTKEIRLALKAARQRVDAFRAREPSRSLTRSIAL
jgi:hypothetical protein